MAKLDELIPLYLKACAVEGKTDRTLQAYDETMRRLRSACSVLAIPEEIEAFGAAHGLSVHELDQGPRRVFQHPAPPSAPGEGVLLLVQAHGIRDARTRLCEYRWSDVS